MKKIIVIVMCLFLMACMLCGCGSENKMMIISRRKYQAIINKAFLEGYKAGEEALQRAKITPNMLREYMGLEPLREEIVRNYDGNIVSEVER